MLGDGVAGPIEVIKNGHAIEMGILAGEEGGPAGCADRIGDEGVGEARSFRSKAIQIGVLLTSEPYAEIACSAWSSEKMKRMFGRSAE